MNIVKRVADYQRVRMATMVKVMERIIGQCMIGVDLKDQLLSLQWVSFLISYCVSQGRILKRCLHKSKMGFELGMVNMH